MKKHEVVALIDEKMNEVFAVLQQQDGITEGDIDPMDAVELDELSGKMADLILRVIQYQK